MPPASNNVCVTADLNASKDNSFSAMNCLLADGYSPVTQGNPRRPASPQSPRPGTGMRGPLAAAGASPRHPAAAPAARPWPLSEPCGVPASIFGGEGLGNPPEQPLRAACLLQGGGTSALSCPKAAPALSGEADATASSPSPVQPSARARFGSPAATGSGH